MTLIVEDGSIVANANSYQTLAEIRAYAAARGVTLSAVDATLETLAIKAVDYLEAQRARYQGEKAVPGEQALQWPRLYVQIDCVDFPADEIPKELKAAQCQLCIELHNGIDIQPTSIRGFAIEETVGPLTTKYSERIGTVLEPTMSAVDNLLAPLFSNCGQRFSLRSIRI